MFSIQSSSSVTSLDDRKLCMNSLRANVGSAEQQQAVHLHSLPPPFLLSHAGSPPFCSPSLLLPGLAQSPSQLPMAASSPASVPARTFVSSPASTGLSPLANGPHFASALFPQMLMAAISRNPTTVGCSGQQQKQKQKNGPSSSSSSSAVTAQQFSPTNGGLFPFSGTPAAQQQTFPSQVQQQLQLQNNLFLLQQQSQGQSPKQLSPSAADNAMANVFNALIAIAAASANQQHNGGNGMSTVGGERVGSVSSTALPSTDRKLGRDSEGEALCPACNQQIGKEPSQWAKHLELERERVWAAIQELRGEGTTNGGGTEAEGAGAEEEGHTETETRTREKEKQLERIRENHRRRLAAKAGTGQSRQQSASQGQPPTSEALLLGCGNCLRSAKELFCWDCFQQRQKSPWEQQNNGTDPPTAAGGGTKRRRTSPFAKALRLAEADEDMPEGKRVKLELGRKSEEGTEQQASRMAD